MSREATNPGPAIDVRRTLTRNTAWNYTGFAVNLLTNLLLFPYVVHEIGDAAAGIWLLLGSVTGYMGLLELGLVPSLAQSVAGSPLIRLTGTPSTSSSVQVSRPLRWVSKASTRTSNPMRASFDAVRAAQSSAPALAVGG